MIKLAMKFLIEEVKKGKQVVGYKLGGVEYKTQKALKEAISDDPEVRVPLRETLLNVVKDLGA